MGSVLWRDGGKRLVIQWQDALGRQQQRALRTTGLDGLPLSRRSLDRDARRRLADLELEVDRQRHGLAPVSSDVLRRPLAWLFDWWWDHRGKTRNSPAIKAFVKKHLEELLELPLGQVTAAEVGKRLNELEGTLAPKSRKHLRSYLYGAFELARTQGSPWAGRSNPVDEVPPIKVPKTRRRIVEADEMPLVLAAFDADLQGPVATALYCGLREGELFGAMKADVDLEGNLLWVGRSWDQARTKDGKALPVPIPPQLRPYLELALQSPGALLFPDPRPAKKGAMYPKTYRVRTQLRRALVKAGLVDGYEWRCRAWKCGWKERHPSPTPPEACPKCKRPATWSRALPRAVRFHDTRHSYGTQMVRAAGLAAAQEALRHSDVRLTKDTYGHLDLADLREGVAAAFGEQITAGPLRGSGGGRKKKARVR